MITTPTKKQKHKSTAKLRGAWYVRESTSKQEDSAERQIADIKAIPLFRDCTITTEHEYSDHAMTGTKSKDRRGFQRLLADADAGEIDVVFLSESSRLTREDVFDQLMHYKRLIDGGVRVVTTRKGEIKFDDLGDLLTNIVDFHGNRDESIKIADRVTHARYLAVLRGEWPSAAPFAYKKEYREPERRKGGYLVLGDEHDQHTVRWIFQQYTETDTSLRALARTLNRKDTSSPSGTPWSPTSVRNLIVRSCYRGMAIYNRTSRGQFRTMSDSKVSKSPGGHTDKPEADWLYQECPAIVSEETWQAAQMKLKKRTNRKTPHVGGGGFLLSGLLWCANCGGPMRGRQEARRQGRRSYFCGHNVAFGGEHCSHNTINEPLLLTFLIDTIREKVLSPASFERLRKSIKRKLARSNDPVPDETKRLRRRLRELDQQIRDGVAELTRAPEDLYSLVVDRVRLLRSERDQVAANLEEAESKAQRPQGDGDSDVERVISRLSRLRGNITSVAPEIAREALQSCIARVDLSFEPGKKKGCHTRFLRGTVTVSPESLLIQQATLP